MSKQESESWNFSPLVLFDQVKNSFRKSTEDYNQVLITQKKLDLRMLRNKKEGVILPAIKKTVTNRYYGVLNLPNAFNNVAEGFLWLSYIWCTPQRVLQEHVTTAAESWAWDQVKWQGDMTLSGVFSGVTGVVKGVTKGVVTTVVTSSMTTRRDVDNLVQTSKSVALHPVQVLIASSMVSVLVSSFLKQMAKTSKQEITRQMFKGTRTVWRISGIAAVAYGLKSISDAMEDLGPFGKSLKERRDESWKVKSREVQLIWRGLIPYETDRTELYRLVSEKD